MLPYSENYSRLNEFIPLLYFILLDAGPGTIERVYISLDLLHDSILPLDTMVHRRRQAGTEAQPQEPGPVILPLTPTAVKGMFTAPPRSPDDHTMQYSQPTGQPNLKLTDYKV